MAAHSNKFPKGSFVCALSFVFLGIVTLDRARHAELTHSVVPGRFGNALSPAEAYLAGGVFIVAGLVWIVICVYTFRRTANSRENT
jgi:hypothetical protein